MQRRSLHRPPGQPNHQSLTALQLFELIRSENYGAASDAFEIPHSAVNAHRTSSARGLNHRDLNLRILRMELVTPHPKITAERYRNRQNADLAVNFCTMDLQRNVELEFDVMRACFDGAAPGCRQHPRDSPREQTKRKMEFFFGTGAALALIPDLASPTAV